MQVRVAEDVTSHTDPVLSAIRPYRGTGDVTGIPAAVGDEENVRRAPALVAAAAAGPVGCRQETGDGGWLGSQRHLYHHSGLTRCVEIIRTLLIT